MRVSSLFICIMCITGATGAAGAAPGQRAPAPVVAAPRAASDYVLDFEQLWKELREGYAYAEEKQIDWDSAQKRLAPRARQIAGREAFIGLLEEAMDTLYDAHAGLRTNTAHSFRLVPTGADLWADFTGERAFVTAVRPGSAAARAGLRAGQELLAIAGVPVGRAVAEQLPPAATAAARGWALRRLLAGRHDERRRLTIAAAAGPREVTIADAEHAAPAPLLSSRRLSPQAGYIRIQNSLGDDGLVAAFDAALAELANSPALILDLRDTPSGGNSSIAEAILGRFVSEPRLYQRHELPGAGYKGRSRLWAQYVTSRGPFTYQGRLVVLVDHWTGSMGEGMAIGVDGMGRGVVVGTAMAGLNGAVYSQTLQKTGIGFSYPAERLFHVNGTPRHLWLPPVRVELRGQDDPGRDAILERALLLLHTPG
jgi:carboxyl-terminal processing protease